MARTGDQGSKIGADEVPGKFEAVNRNMLVVTAIRSSKRWMLYAETQKQEKFLNYE